MSEKWREVRDCSQEKFHTPLYSALSKHCIEHVDEQRSSNNRANIGAGEGEGKGGE